uniref:NPA domain-containing protein n=1 Tax=Steinernema glaseri TaxID=37863 RepID=A0A1I8A8R1_9BILA
MAIPLFVGEVRRGVQPKASNTSKPTKSPKRWRSAVSTAQLYAQQKDYYEAQAQAQATSMAQQQAHYYAQAQAYQSNPMYAQQVYAQVYNQVLAQLQAGQKAQADVFQSQIKAQQKAETTAMAQQYAANYAQQVASQVYPAMAPVVYGQAYSQAMSEFEAKYKQEEMKAEWLRLAEIKANEFSEVVAKTVSPGDFNSDAFKAAKQKAFEYSMIRANEEMAAHATKQKAFEYSMIRSNEEMAAHVMAEAFSKTVPLDQRLNAYNWAKEQAMSTLEAKRMKEQLEKEKEGIKGKFIDIVNYINENHYHTPTLEDYMKFHFTWLTLEQKQGLKKLKEQGMTKDKLQVEIFTLYSNASKEVQAKAKKEFYSACRELLTEVIGQANASKLKAMKESGAAFPALQKKAMEFINAVTDSSKQQIVKDYHDVCYQVFSM